MGDDKALQVELNEPLREAREAKLLLAIESPNQLQEMLVDFWDNHFNVYGEKEIDRVFMSNYEDKAIRPYVFGHFRDMLEATAKSPAMLFYLDQWKDVAPAPGGQLPVNNKKDAEGINENYAREVMELHTLGVDGGYTQKDVTELARILTGWGYGDEKLPATRQSGPAQDASNAGNRCRPPITAVFTSTPRIMITGPKSSLAILSSPTARPRAKRRWTCWPTARLRLSTSATSWYSISWPTTRPATIVQRMTDTWLHTRGDLRAVMRSLVDSPEFWDPQYRGAKYRTPFQYVVAASRAAGVPVDITIGLGSLKKMGELPYDCLTPDGYKNTADAWLNPSATADRLAFAIALGSGNLQKQHVGINPNGTPDKQTDPGPAVPLNATQIEATLGNNFSPNTLQAIAAGNPQMQGAMVLGSPEMMRR